ncbi:MAG: transcription-repair coupling factor [Holosporales bacterium]|jgi:transcription-repair coupling factor (superfamily II helicase)|nr:transcription-repair coupling factor [Holosporales bacterium]
MFSGEKSSRNVIGGVNNSRVPLLCFELYKCGKSVVFVADSEKTALYVRKVLEGDLAKYNALWFADYNDDCRDPLAVISLSSACYRVLSEKPYIAITTIPAIHKKVVPPKYFLESFKIKKNSEIQMVSLQRLLGQYGYTRMDITVGQGQFSVRGGIIDIFPIVSDIPYRIDFLGNIVESIRKFDRETQLSNSEIEEINITKTLDLSQNSDCTLLDYINDDAMFIFDFGIFDEKIAKNFEFIKTQPFKNIPPEVREAPAGVPGVSDESCFADDNTLAVNIRTEKGIHSFLDDIKKYQKIIISVSSLGAINIVSDILKPYGNFEVVRSDLAEGFVRNDTAIYTEKELFGYTLRSSHKRLEKKTVFKNYTNLFIGNYIVHKEYGIGIFNGLVNIDVGDCPRDFLELIYRDNDKLYVPAENIDLVSKYGNDGTDIELDKLGGTSWKKRRTRIQKKLLIIADNLLKIAAKRKTVKVEPIEIDNEEYRKFCHEFPYIETDDQLASIEDIVNDLHGTTPMDRLICGDVGFGKTEVALRAAFIVASAGRQVILMAPTTILVNQHYKNFTERFKNTTIRVCKLSRLISNPKEVIANIGDGKVDIIIATHSILSSKIKFKNIGMLIIDEEQHFGVKQKEFIKSLGENIHVITMTATPIPRTLQMSLSGIRELSIIASAPSNRLPVKTFIIEQNDETLKRAISTELERKGQVFVVSPRIEFLDNLYKKIQHLTRDSTIDIKVTNGTDPLIEETINDFCNGNVNILISTNIIDSGIDIPNANTIIIDRADMFGLSQLYQLRGRVGRQANIQGYAYMFIPKNKKITEDAQKRLQVIEKLTGLGAGFILASEDMEIRGAGNIVGDTQTGHIKDVGVELYNSMLERAILMKESEEFSPQINIGIPIMIPKNYIEDDNLRMSIYRRIGDIETVADIEDMEFELADRFGRIPDELSNLLTVIKIKLSCIKAGIEKIDVMKNGVLLSFYNNAYHTPSKIIHFVEKNKNMMKFANDNKVLINKKWQSTYERTKDILSIVKFLE